MSEQSEPFRKIFTQPAARVVYVIGTQAPEVAPVTEEVSSAELTEELEGDLGPDKFSLAAVSPRELRSHMYEMLLLLSAADYQPPSQFGYEIVTSLTDQVNELVDADKDQGFEDVAFEGYLNKATRQLEPKMLETAGNRDVAQEQIACLIDAREWLRWTYSNTWDLEDY
jgi:hypothetical protein